ncbi:hypothetical protein, partial [Microcystis aeruginosa]|uniref:hypothetical protein n=1 Tax=Microcystis aeruginosa TaxID=1126 RepID=UPI001C126B4B
AGIDIRQTIEPETIRESDFIQKQQLYYLILLQLTSKNFPVIWLSGYLVIWFSVNLVYRIDR